jgi:hypothetical protein
MEFTVVTQTIWVLTPPLAIVDVNEDLNTSLLIMPVGISVMGGGVRPPSNIATERTTYHDLHEL